MNNLNNVLDDIKKVQDSRVYVVHNATNEEIDWVNTNQEILNSSNITVVQYSVPSTDIINLYVSRTKV